MAKYTRRELLIAALTARGEKEVNTMSQWTVMTRTYKGQRDGTGQLLPAKPGGCWFISRTTGTIRLGDSKFITHARSPVAEVYNQLLKEGRDAVAKA